MADIYFTSDTHFGHANIIKYCSRPYDTVHEMNKGLTEDWNAVVKSDDIVYHLGDFSFNSDQYVHRLNGRIILVKGNHDNGKYNQLFEGVVEFMPMKIAEFNCYLIHTPIDRQGQYKKGREPDFTILDRYDFVICGHVHEKWKVLGKNVNVGVDIWKKPVHIDELARFLRSLKTP